MSAAAAATVESTDSSQQNPLWGYPCPPWIDLRLVLVKEFEDAIRGLYPQVEIDTHCDLSNAVSMVCGHRYEVVSFTERSLEHSRDVQDSAVGLRLCAATADPLVRLFFDEGTEIDRIARCAARKIAAAAEKAAAQKINIGCICLSHVVKDELSVGHNVYIYYRFTDMPTPQASTDESAAAAAVTTTPATTTTTASTTTPTSSVVGDGMPELGQTGLDFDPKAVQSYHHYLSKQIEKWGEMQKQPSTWMNDAMDRLFAKDASPAPCNCKCGKFHAQTEFCFARLEDDLKSVKLKKVA